MIKKLILAYFLFIITTLTIVAENNIDNIVHIPLTDSKDYKVDIVRIQHVGDETRITLEFPFSSTIGFYTGGTYTMRLNGNAFRFFYLDGKKYTYTTSNIRRITANGNSIIFVFPRISTAKFSLYECEHTSTKSCFNTVDADSGIAPTNDDPWRVLVKNQYSVPKNAWFSKTFTISNNIDNYGNEEELDVILDGSSNIKLVIQTKDAYGKKLDNYRYKFVGKIASTTDIALTFEDASRSFSKTIPVRFNTSTYKIDGVTPNRPFVIVNGDDITYPLSLVFDTTKPSGSSAEPTCRTTGVVNSIVKTFDLDVTEIGDNRYKCRTPENFSTNYELLDFITSVDSFSVEIGFDDQYIAYKTVNVEVYKRDALTAKAILEFMPEYEDYNSGKQTFVVVNKRAYSIVSNDTPDKIYLGGDTALYGPRKFNKDSVFLTGGVWKLTYQGHEMLLEVKGSYGRSSQLYFTVDGSGDLHPSEPLLQFTFDPESSLNILIKKNVTLAKVRGFLYSGTLWKSATLDPIKKEASFKVKECKNPFSIVSMAEASEFGWHPCGGHGNDGYYPESLNGAVRGTTISIEKKKNKPIVFNVLEGEVELDLSSSDENITLYDMETVDIKEKKVTSISANVLSPLQEQYLQETSLNVGDENSTVGTVNVQTNLDNVSYYIYNTDKVQVGHGKFTSFENLLDGEYGITFLDIPRYLTPEDKRVTVSGGIINIDVNYKAVANKKILVEDTEQFGLVQRFEFDHFELASTKNQLLTVKLSALSDDLDLYVRINGRPSLEYFDCRSWLTGEEDEVCTLEVKKGDYIYIGVSGEYMNYPGAGSWTNFTIKVNLDEDIDTDSDGIINRKDTDDDNDGLSDILELKYGLNPLNASDAQADFDHDGFSNAIEISMGTNIRNAKSKPVWAPIMIGDIVTFVPSK